MDHTNELRTISFFTGMRGIERGLKMAGTPIAEVAYVEREAFPLYNLVAQMEQGVVAAKPLFTDIEAFRPEPFRNRVHLLTGGYPCQGESVAGKRLLKDDPRFVWNYLERAIEAINPLCCFFENVDGHLTGSFSYILSRLREMGYGVEAGIYSAAEVGAPQTRKRVFILAFADAGELWRSLANSECQQLYLSDIPGWCEAPRVGEGCDLLADTQCQRSRESYQGTKSGVTDKVGGLGEDKLANYCCTGCQRTQQGELQRERSKLHGSTSQCRAKWPAKPGHAQQEWEAPRTIEPGLGSTVNGYDFRRDLLRMYGNGVVKQTAAKAWIDLLRKVFTLNQPQCQVTPKK